MDHGRVSRGGGGDFKEETTPKEKSGGMGSFCPPQPLPLRGTCNFALLSIFNQGLFALL